MIRVLIVDDHTIFRSGLKRLFSDENDICVVDEASNSTEALDKIRKHELDLVLMDVSMAGRSGLEALESLRIEFPQLPVLILSMYSEEQYAVVAMKAGANGYLSKDAEPAELIGAIRKIAAGGRYLTNRGTELMLMQFSGKDDRPTHQKLSTREFEIMRMIANGISLTEIGERLNISVKTVSTYRTRILEKIGVKSNAELAKFALRNEIV
ncbi:response regulator UvrY [mine drainage metagenome]|jgi:two-component system, NarL family, invasion response regulator UvrY|uniref:Response regulator UvrY n=1 Tax=mine drainage metagenome TaxID=410659 RepID=A0A1J5SQR2_9ZZZZ